ncbi:MAG: hypothetical protein LQ351_001225 [Letrouitia transgressa]|nr:MAG: hypothetical protein LQ351_001225 [Letrouitia transgressa]
MYMVSAQVNDVEIVKVPLDTVNAFQLQPDAINAVLSSDPRVKVVYLCSPGNPTGNLISKSAIEKILAHPTWNGVVVVDEAYIDFSPDGSSLAEWVTEWPNLAVMQTLSKAFGLAGIRLGVTFTSIPIASLLNNLKAPYNISSPTSEIAKSALRPENLAIMRRNKGNMVEQRQRMLKALPLIPRIGRFLGGTDAKFLLFEILGRPRISGGNPSSESALKLYEELAETRAVVVRFRGKEPGRLGCLRITVGTEAEVEKLIAQLRDLLGEESKEIEQPIVGSQEEQEANDIIA